jgi:hypothetical protein
MQLMKEHCETGMDPVELGEWLKRGIEAGQVYIIPYRNAYELISREHERERNYASPEGMAKEDARDAFFAELMRVNPPKPGEGFVLMEKGASVGLGRAREDIDWVHQSKQFDTASSGR